MNETEKPEAHKFISAHQAYIYACAELKSSAMASEILRDALAEGLVSAEADAILEEYAFASVKALHKRRKKVEIHLQERTQNAALRVECAKFKRSPKGSRVVYNWKLSRVTWIEPPVSELFTHRASGRLGAPLQKRIVLYGVQLERSSVEVVVKKVMTCLKISSAVSAKPKKKYEKSSDTKERLSSLYKLAAAGELAKYYGPFNEYGKKALLKHAISTLVSHEFKRTKLQAFATDLIALDIDSAREAKEDQLSTFKS